VRTMKKTTPYLVLILLANSLAQVSACASHRGGSVDARAGADASSCVHGGTTYAPGETFSMGCQSCRCLPTGEVACSAGLCLVDSGATEPARQDTLPSDRCGSSAETCLYGSGTLAVGESGVDGCSIYTCGAGGTLTCTAGGCPAVDASTAADCSLPTPMVFGYYGGFEPGSRITLETSGTVTATTSAGPCVSRLPACGTGCAITVATIARDLANPEVQAALAAGSGSVYGVSLISQDVADFVVTLGDGRSIEVGVPCCRFPDLPCQPISDGVQRLVNDLKSLMAGIAVCTSP